MQVTVVNDNGKVRVVCPKCGIVNSFIRLGARPKCGACGTTFEVGPDKPVAPVVASEPVSTTIATEIPATGPEVPASEPAAEETPAATTSGEMSAATEGDSSNG